MIPGEEITMDFTDEHGAVSTVVIARVVATARCPCGLEYAICDVCVIHAEPHCKEFSELSADKFATWARETNHPHTKGWT
jgi:hypothetical protein